MPSVNGGNADKLAQIGITQALEAQAQQQASQRDANLKQLLMGQQHQNSMDEATQKTQLGVDSLQKVGALAKSGQLPTNMGISADGVSVSPKDNTMGMMRADAQQEKNRQNLITKIKADYDKVSGPATKRMGAAQSVLDALNRGDITTVGRIKAQLPTLEGENYKPTDAERELILQPTAAGNFAKLKNFLGGDSAAVSQSQTEALKKFVQDKLNEEQQGLGRNRKEVLMRYKPNVKALSGDQLDALSSTLGMSNEDLMGHLQNQLNSGAPTSVAGPKAAAPAGMAGMPDQNAIMAELARRKGKK